MDNITGIQGAKARQSGGDKISASAHVPDGGRPGATTQLQAAA